LRFPEIKAKNPVMAQYVYTMNRVGKIVPPKRVILKDISLSFFPGAKIGVLGLNGSGKSSLLRIMAGEDKEFEGEAVPMPDMRIGFLPQEPLLDASQTVREAVEEGLAEILGAKAKLDEIYAAYAEPDADFDKLAAEQAKYENIIAASGGETEVQMEIAADALRLPPWDAKVAKLSGGEKRRVALCRLLLSKPDMLLLDEPTNHLDAESVEWLEQFLQRFPGTVIAVTHDRYFLDNAAEWILELDRGYGIPWKGNYSSWLEQKEARLKTEAKQEVARIKAMQDRARMGAPEREGPAGEGQGAYRPLRGARLLRAPAAQRDAGDLHSRRGAARRLRDRVQRRQQRLRRSPADRRSVVQYPGGRDRGHHRSEWRRQDDVVPAYHGQEKPDKGNIVIGASARLAVVDQTRESLPNDKTVWEAISGGQDILTVGRFEMPSRAYLGRFNFKGGDQQKMVGSLSGGERGRLHLAATLLKGGNVLLLDEPSNDLDVETLRALEDALSEFAGSVLVISHDRWFLDRIATHILAAEGDSQWSFFEGNYQEYEADKRKRLGEAGAQPHRIRYKALMQ
jgi:sulfate-transporting ATPase